MFYDSCTCSAVVLYVVLSLLANKDIHNRKPALLLLSRQVFGSSSHTGLCFTLHKAQTGYNLDGIATDFSEV